MYRPRFKLGTYRIQVSYLSADLTFVVSTVNVKRLCLMLTDCLYRFPIIYHNTYENDAKYSLLGLRLTTANIWLRNYSMCYANSQLMVVDTL